ncbi:MAG: hypothetical protein IJB76_07675 [Clostridia bacterium]|nr:hypothetical protein [Clostridia bacterium]
MKRFKKALALILSSALLASAFTACGKDEKAESTGKGEESSEIIVSAEDSGENEQSLIARPPKPDRPHRPDRPPRPDTSGDPEEPMPPETSVDWERPNGLVQLPLDEHVRASEIDSYFDDSLFIGYSIMMHFGRYVGEWRDSVDESILGTAQFCAGVSVGFTVDRTQTPDMPENSLPLYQGKAYNFADLPAATDAKALYIGLSAYSCLKRAPDDATCVLTAYNEAVMGIERIREKNPDLPIVILSGTYNTEIYEGLTRERCSNAQVLEYNNLVLDYCTENGIDFIDVSTILTDENGLLNEDFANDGEYHMVKNVYYIWIELLRDYAKQKQEGTWANPTDMPNLPAF